jgi:hypothetical protein
MLLERRCDAKAYSSDNHFPVEEGLFVRCNRELGKAHKECQEAITAYLEKGAKVAVVHNSSLTTGEIDTYKQIAEQCGAVLLVVSFDLPAGVSDIQGAVILRGRNLYSSQGSYILGQLIRQEGLDLTGYDKVINVPIRFTTGELQKSEVVMSELPPVSCEVADVDAQFYATGKVQNWGLAKLYVGQDGIQTVKGCTGEGLNTIPDMGVTAAYGLRGDRLEECKRTLDGFQAEYQCDKLITHGNALGDRIQFLVVSAVGIPVGTSAERVDFMTQHLQLPLHMTIGVSGGRPPADSNTVMRSLDLSGPTLYRY